MREKQVLIINIIIFVVLNAGVTWLEHHFFGTNILLITSLALLGMVFVGSDLIFLDITRCRRLLDKDVLEIISGVEIYERKKFKIFISGNNQKNFYFLPGFFVGSSIIISKGAMDCLTKKELQALMCVGLKNLEQKGVRTLYINGLILFYFNLPAIILEQSKNNLATTLAKIYGLALYPIEYMHKKMLASPLRIKEMDEGVAKDLGPLREIQSALFKLYLDDYSHHENGSGGKFIRLLSLVPDKLSNFEEAIVDNTQIAQTRVHRLEDWRSY